MMLCRRAAAAAAPSVQRAAAMHTEKKIEELGYILPPLGEPKGNYRPCVRTGNVIYTAGHLPAPAGKDLIVGKIGQDLTPEDGYEAAHYAALSIITTLKGTVLGIAIQVDWDRQRS